MVTQYIWMYFVPGIISAVDFTDVRFDGADAMVPLQSLPLKPNVTHT